jgi:WD40 repeat protein
MCVFGQQYLREQKAIELPGVSGRIDHFSPDVKGRRLFISALVNRTIEIVDVDSGRRLRSISGIPEPQGVFYHEPSDKLYAACRADGSVRSFDGAGFKPLSLIRLPGGDADNIRFDQRGRRIVVGFGDGALVLLGEDGKKTGEIPLGAHPESFQIESGGQRVFINVPDRREVQVANPSTLKVEAHWPVTDARQNYPMALDEPDGRLFLGCRSPARLLVLDTHSGKNVAAVEITGDTDDLFFDLSRKLIYVIGGAGAVDIIRQEAPDRYERVARQNTAPGARTGLWVREWNRLFVAAPKRGSTEARVLVFATN